MLPPDVNRSGADFTVAGGQDPLSACRPSRPAAGRPPGPSPTSAPAAATTAASSTSANGSTPGTVNRAAVESLLKAGAFDSIHGARAQLFAALDRALQAGSAAASDRRSGQKNLFGGDEDQSASEAAPRRPAQRARVARPRTSGQGKGSARLLPFQPSAGRAPEHAGRLLLAYDDRGRGPEAPRRSHARRDAGGREVRPHQESQARQPQPLCHVRPGGHRRPDPLHRLAGAVRALRTADPGRRGGGRPRRRR